MVGKWMWISFSTAIRVECWCFCVHGPVMNFFMSQKLLIRVAILNQDCSSFLRFSCYIWMPLYYVDFAHASGFFKRGHALQLAGRFWLTDVGSVFSYYFIYCIIKSIRTLEAKKMFYIAIWLPPWSSLAHFPSINSVHTTPF